jgi:adiponectin receptor
MLLSYDEIPDWYQDNHYIRHGYRPESGSVKACYASWFYLNNETVNIFSHLIPALIFLSAEIWIFNYIENFPQAKSLEHFVFAFFLLTAFVCLGLSATYHTLMNHSAKISHLWLQFDFVGIVILTIGDFVSGIYMVFYCEPTLQKVYWTMVREHREYPNKSLG